MRISFQDLENKDIVSEWELNPSQERFWRSNKKVILFSGGVRLREEFDAGT